MRRAYWQAGRLPLRYCNMSKNNPAGSSLPVPKNSGFVRFRKMTHPHPLFALKMRHFLGGNHDTNPETSGRFAGALT